MENTGNTFTDETLMPFGKFKGQKLANVPSSYLLWMHGELKVKRLSGPAFRDHVRLLEYINENMDVLKTESK